MSLPPAGKKRYSGRTGGRRGAGGGLKAERCTIVEDTEAGGVTFSA